jgi:NADH:ubiquinone oxidoreductase subunit 5 (subunit L)/multisubunit Na+/H+ antiporter MnhA subunit
LFSTYTLKQLLLALLILICIDSIAALFIGACGKSAQIPLYTWADAMAGPTLFSINTCCNDGNCRYLYDYEIELFI